MAKAKIAVTLDGQLVRKVDGMVRRGEYPSRSRAIESVLSRALADSRHARLARETAKCEPAEEVALAELGLAEDLQAWPEY